MDGIPHHGLPHSSGRPVPLERSGISVQSLLEWIVGCQADPARGTAYLGDTPAGVRDELAGLDQDWTQTVRVVTEQGQPVAACAVEWDEEPAAAWIQGPWGAPEAVEAWGEALVRAMVEQLPPEVTRLELCGELGNTAMAELAERMGWTPTAANHAMVLPVKIAREVSRRDPGGVDAPKAVTVRDATSKDVALLAELHESEFPDAYATPGQLLSRHLTVVALQGDALVGYAAGQVQDDGQAYIDFTAVVPEARRQGVGRALIIALIGRLLEAADPSRLARVHLTVQEERAAARGLYESLGFHTDASIRGYRGMWTVG